MVLNNAVNSINPVVQIVSTSTSSVVTCSTTIPRDNTIPQQSTEGTLVLSLAITPKFSTSILVIEFSGEVNCNGTATSVGVALFQDSTANALSAKHIAVGASNATTANLLYTMTAGTTSSTTFKIHCGGNASTIYVNADSAGTRLMGGVSSTTLTITEYYA